MADAAYCQACGRVVRLGSDGVCPAGHPRSHLHDVRDVALTGSRQVSVSDRPTPPRIAWALIVAGSFNVGTAMLAAGTITWLVSIPPGSGEILPGGFVLALLLVIPAGLCALLGAIQVAAWFGLRRWRVLTAGIASTTIGAIGLLVGLFVGATLAGTLSRDPWGFLLLVGLPLVWAVTMATIGVASINWWRDSAPAPPRPPGGS